MDPYKVLDIPPTADAATIKAAYKRKARKAHPDRKSGDHDEMSSINAAYALLSDDSRRFRYDQTGATDTPPPREHKAREMVLQAMAAHLDSGSEEDPTKSIRRSLEKFKFEVTSGLTQARRALVTTEKAQARIKDDGLFADLFAQRLRGIRLAISEMEGNLEIAGMALDLLKNVAWTGEEPTKQGTYYTSLSGLFGGA